MHSTEKKALALNLLLSLLMAAGYMLLFAYNNTPLGAAIGSDNAMYLTMGTALAKGWAPCSLRFRGCRSGSAAAIT